MTRPATPAPDAHANPALALAVAHLHLQCRDIPPAPWRRASVPRWAARWLHRLRDPSLPAPGAAQALRVSIQALDGRVLLRHSAPAAVLDIGLPPGTYHVSVHRGEACRRYTVTLLPHADIRLQLVPPGPP